MSLFRKYLTSICFLPGNKGWIVGHTESKPGKTVERVAGNLFFRTDDGGNTWQGQIHHYPTGFAGHEDPAGEAPNRLIGVRFATSSVGVTVCKQSWYYRTIDEGFTWQQKSRELAFTGENWLDIGFVDDKNGWVGMSFTTDRGDSWSARKSPDSEFVWSAVSFRSPQEGWVAGRMIPSPAKPSEARIYHTLDGGLTWDIEWSSQEPGAYLTLISYDIVTDTVWAAGAPGVILKRTLQTTAVRLKGKLPIVWDGLKATSSPQSVR